MTTVSLDLQPNTSLTLGEAISSLLTWLEPKALLMPRKSEIPIVLLTGIMAPLAPLVYLRLWKSDTLWFFRLRRKKASATVIVAHPLNIFALWLSLTGLLVLTSVCLKYRYGNVMSVAPLRAYMAVVLVSWVIIPLGPMYTILGTASTLSDSLQGPVGWLGKAGRVMCGKNTLNGATVAAPLLWLGCTLPFVVLSQVHFAKCLEGLVSLQAAESAASEASTSAMTVAQLSTFVQAWGHLKQSIWSLGIIAALWAAFVSVEVLTLSTVGLRVLLLLYGHLTAMKGSSGTTHSAAQNLGGKKRYIRESMVVLGGFYLMTAVSGITLVVTLALTARELFNSQGRDALKWFRLGNLIFQWVIAVNGLGVMLLVSGRVHAAVTAEAAPHRLATSTTRSATMAFAEGGNTMGKK